LENRENRALAQSLWNLEQPIGIEPTPEPWQIAEIRIIKDLQGIFGSIQRLERSETLNVPLVVPTREAMFGVCQATLQSIRKQNLADSLPAERLLLASRPTSLTFRFNCSKMLVCVLSLPADS